MQLDHGEVVIIGAGVNGLSTGWRLAREGVDVVVLEKSLVGWEASGRNGGAFSSAINSVPTKAAIARLNAKLWETMDEDLGYPTEFTPGVMIVALDEQTLYSLRKQYEDEQAAGVESYMLDLPAIREMAPLIGDKVQGGLFEARSGHANPQRTVQAYAWAIQDLGGRVYQHAGVTDINVSGGKVVSVETVRGTVGADFVVSAAGPQTGLICEMVGAYVPVAQGRVEIIVTEPLPIMPMGKVSGNGLYGRQAKRGNLVYGGGLQEWIDVDLSSPEKPNTPLIRNIGKRLAELYPSAADVRIIRSWGGVVEQSADQAPIIDTLSDPSNFLVLSLSGDGFGISAGVGMVVSELVMHGESSVPVGDDVRLARFAGISSDWRAEKGWSPAP